MKVLIALTALVALTSALPWDCLDGRAYPYFNYFGRGYPWAHAEAYPYGKVIVDGPVSMHHIQDSAGSYKFGFTTPTQTREEAKALDGTTVGSYSYVDAEGKLQTVNYHAGALTGFQVEGTNLPVAPARSNLSPIGETPEVAAARLEHERAYAAELAKNSAVAIASAPIVEAPLASFAPVPVAEPAEVILARKEHLLAHELAAKQAIVPMVSSAIIATDAALPRPVEDEPAVKLAKLQHFALKDKITAEHALLGAYNSPWWSSGLYNYGYGLRQGLYNNLALDGRYVVKGC